MLIQFSVRNFKTFKEKATLNLIASSEKETKGSENIANTNNYKLRILKSAVIYGANASGKTKFIEALMFMKNFVISSSKESQKGDKISVEPFRLSAETEDKPSEFEVVFIYQNIMYRYGFEIDKNKIVAEWLFYKPKTKEVEIFYRELQTFETHPKKFQKGARLVRDELTRENALFLSVSAQFNEEISVNVLEWFRNIKFISGLQEQNYSNYSMGLAKDPKQKQKFLALLKSADLGIQDINLQLLDIDNIPNNIPQEIREIFIQQLKEGKGEVVTDILTYHKKFDKNAKYIGNIEFSIGDESAGTAKFFSLIGLILDVIENGTILMADELDAKIHPNLVAKIVSLFNSKDLNPKNAQLVFNTHDTNLLSEDLFRKDQIWFTEKNSLGEARLYSLADFKADEVRKTEAFESNYLRGKYGGIPILGLFERNAYQTIVLKNEDEK